MHRLHNPRHERFAQALAEGKSQQAAYVFAGYSPRGARANATKLLQREHRISQRVAEILEERRQIAGATLSATVQNTKVDHVWIDRRLVEIVERCMQARPVVDRQGNPVYVETPTGALAPAYTFDAASAISALRLLGLERGMFRPQFVQPTDPFADLPVAVVKEIMDALKALRDARNGEPDAQAHVH
jgi:hypothetical protein